MASLYLLPGYTVKFSYDILHVPGTYFFYSNFVGRGW